MIVGQRLLSRESIERVESSGRSVGHSDGYRAVQRDDGRWADLKQGVIEKHDPLPVGLCYGVGSRMTRSDRRLQGVTMGAAIQILRAMERGHSSLDLCVVPQRTVLFRQENGFSGWSATRCGTRRLQLHQRQESVDLRLLGKELREHASQAECIVAECCPHPLVPGGCGVSLVEDQIDDGQHRLKPLSQLVTTRSLKGNMSLGQCLLGSKDALA